MNRTLSTSLKLVCGTMLIMIAIAGSAVQATPVTSGTGPGGVGRTDGATTISGVAELGLWLRADLGITLSGTNVTAWQDQSGHARNASQSDPNSQPVFFA